MDSKTDNQTEFDLVEDETQKNQTLETEDSKEISNNNNQIIAQSAKNKLKGRRMNREEREQALTMLFLIAQLIPSGYHIVLYGAAGSGKTTVILFLCEQILIAHPKVEIYYLYLDGQLGMAATYEEHLEENGLDERYNIITNGNANENLILIEDMIRNNEVNPSEMVVVLDTLKFLNGNILSKNANVGAMHRIKALTNKGVTFITLHHTNKDGENFAGTAEIEQDSDALLKIDTTDGDEPHTKISTINEGGRVRFFLEPRSFSFRQGDPTTVKMLDNAVDADKISKEKEDSYFISIIKGLLNLKGELSKSELEKYLKEDDDFDCSDKERKRIISMYINKHWSVRKGGDRNQCHYYSAIDTVSGSIDTINQNLSVPQKV